MAGAEPSLEKEVAGRKWHGRDGRAGKNIAVYYYVVVFGIHSYVWKGIIPLHVKFCQHPCVPHSFNSLV